MMEQHQAPHSLSTISLKASLVAFFLGLLSIVLALILGNSAFNSSITELEEQYRHIYLREAKMLSEIVRLGGRNDEQSLLEELQAVYQKVGGKPSDEYLCIVDRSANLIVHTAHPDSIGNNAGDNPIFGETDSPEKCLADLVSSQRDYVGDYISSSGQSQLAAFAAVPDRQWVLGIHRSKQALRDHIEEGIQYSKTGFYLVCGVLMPLSVLLIFVTFYVAEKKRLKAEDALAASERKWRQVLVNTPQIGISLDRNAKIVFVNDHFQKLTGWEEDEIIGKDWFDQCLPENIRGEIRDVFTTVVSRKDTSDLSTYENDILIKNGQLRRISWSNVLTKDAAGQVVDITCLGIDITERKRLEEALKQRILALTQPLDANEGIAFEDLFNLEDIQRLQDQFAEATGVASVITVPDGTPITRPSNFCRLCRDIIRKTEKGLSNCFKSDAVLGKPRRGGPNIQICLSGGLWDAGAGISIGGKHIANWLIGQVRDTTQTDESMRTYAREIGADEESVIQAFHEIPPMSREQFGAVAEALYTLANQLSAIAYQNVQQGRFISEKERIEAALKESKDFLDNMSDVAYMADGQGRVVYVNPAIKRITGYSPEQVVGKPFLPLFIEDDHASLMDVYTRTLAGESLENTLTFTSGVTCHFTSLPKYNQQGDIIGTFGVARDITERVQTIEALKESEARFKALHNASFGGIAIHDKGLILECNRGLSDITGYDYDELIDSNMLDLISEDTRAEVIKNIEVGYEMPYEAVGKRKNGALYPLRLEARNIPFKGERVRVVEFRDISENKRAEAERSELETKLRQAQKMESVGRLAGGVAHDFNNMLGVIIGHAEIALEEVDRASTLYTSLKEIRAAAKRSADLTGQLLAFARKQTISPKVVDINATVQGMLSMLKRLIGEHIDLQWMPGKDMWPVKLDPSQIDQILANLCVNARDAIADVGKISIQTTTVELDGASYGDQSDHRPGEYVLLAVSDDGCGMDGETLANIFEPFYTTKAPGQGTGLGLATVYGAVKQNEGFIDVQSAVGQGTTFTIYFPRYLENGEAPRTGAKDRPVVRGHETILLVEDEPAVLQMTKMMLERLGYVVLAAKKPAEAVRLAQSYGGRIDLLLTDVVMPEMNGRDLAKNIVSLYPHLTCLFVSGYPANFIAPHGVVDEDVNFIQKPFSREQFGAKVREVLDKNV